jgi:hypothetical protein
VSVIWNFNDTVLQNETAALVCESVCGEAALCGRDPNLSGGQFWARGYVVSTVGFELEQARQYIRERMRRMEQPGNSEPTNEARNARRIDPRPNRL